jgi:hypothetical protein
MLMLCWQVDNDEYDDDLQLLKLEVLAEVYPEDDTDANYCGDIKIVDHSLQRLYTLHFCSQLALYIPTLRAINSMRSAICFYLYLHRFTEFTRNTCIPIWYFTL